MMSETQIPRTPRRGDITIRRRPVPVVVARRWAVTWAASIALVVATRTVGRAPFVGLLRWTTAAAAALPAHPTVAQILAALPVTLGLTILTLTVIAVLAGPVLVPVLAAGHIAVSWLRGGVR